jgi:3-oxoacyl-[acyl-carrier-protein] synthase-3
MAESAHIIGYGSYLPERVLTNSDLEKMVDTSDAWITSRTGIQERRIAGPEEFSSTMGTLAARRALESCQMDPQEIDLILVATMSPDYPYPSTASLIQAQLGITHAAAMDIQAACSGFIYGLSTAKAYVESGIYRTVLLIASEKMSSLLDYQDRTTCVLFGDGAGAVVVRRAASGFQIGTCCLGTDGSLAQLLYAPAGGSRCPSTPNTTEQRLQYLKMSGQELFKHAVRRMSAAAIECLHTADVTQEEIDWLIPHQANDRIIEAIAKSLHFPTERIYKTLHKYGNTSASSVVIALDALCKEHPLKKNAHLLLLAFGAGLTWGACLLKKC